MIESTLFFVLGFLAASLGALMIAPAIWRRAVRLTERRIEDTKPLTIAEIRADRDMLRAEFARHVRRLELAVGVFRRKVAERMVDASRAKDSEREAVAERGRAMARLLETEAQLTASREDVASALADVSVALRSIEDRDDEITALQAKIADLEYDADTRKMEIAVLKTTIDNLEAQRTQLEDQSRLLAHKILGADREIARRDATIELERERIRKLDRVLLDRGRDVNAAVDDRVTVSRRLEAANERIRALTSELEEARKVEPTFVYAEGADPNGAGDNIATTVESLERSNAEWQMRAEEFAEERDLLSAEVAELRRKTSMLSSEEAGQLRDLLANLAAEVAQVAANAEGENSPIDRILSIDADTDRIVLAPDRPSLADRIRALRQRQPDAIPPAR